VPQGRQVPGDLGLGHLEDLLDLTDAELSVNQEGQDAQAGLVRQGAEDGGGLFHGQSPFHFLSYISIFGFSNIKTSSQKCKGKFYKTSDVTQF
jgi:hypothetical protein